METQLPPAHLKMIASKEAVFVFVRDASGEWAQQAKLQAPDGVARDKFGWSVAVYGEYIVVGAKWDDNGDQFIASGSAHVFVRNGDTWTHQAKLLAPDGGAHG